jgi:hypothetical protein
MNDHSASIGLGGRMRRLLRRDEGGQAAFEFVLILPVFILVILLVIDFAILGFEYVSLSNATREGSRFGAVNCGDGSCTQDDVITRALDRSSGILDSADAADRAKATVGWIDNSVPTDVNSGRGDSVSVRIDHRYEFLFFPVSFPVVSCSDMRLEQRDLTVGLPSATGCD